MDWLIYIYIYSTFLLKFSSKTTWCCKPYSCHHTSIPTQALFHKESCIYVHFWQAWIQYLAQGYFEILVDFSKKKYIDTNVRTDWVCVKNLCSGTQKQESKVYIAETRKKYCPKKQICILKVVTEQT